MNKSLSSILLLLLVTMTYAQESYIQIELADQTTSIYNNSILGYPTYYYDVPIGATDYSNDSGLNTILQGNNIKAYDIVESMQAQTIDGLYINWTLVVCEGCNANQLASDLNAYPTVVKNAYVINDREAYNALEFKLVDSNIGIPTGVNNGIITTNDTYLNTLFTTHNVYYYQQSFPSASSIPDLLKVYTLICDCNASILRTALEAYTTVIEEENEAENEVGVLHLYLDSQLLSVEDEALNKVKLYPNPTNHFLNLNLRNESQVTSIDIYNILGQHIKSIPKELQQSNYSIDVSNLKSGHYLIKVSTERTSKSMLFVKQ